VSGFAPPCLQGRRERPPPENCGKRSGPRAGFLPACPRSPVATTGAFTEAMGGRGAVPACGGRARPPAPATAGEGGQKGERTRAKRGPTQGGAASPTAEKHEGHTGSTQYTRA
jgi:hypothetical protein